MSLEFHAAQQLILSHAHTLDYEAVALGDAVGRVLAEAIVAPWSQPIADNSAMDGYAIAWSPDRRAYRVAGFLGAGQSYAGAPINAEETIKTMTGAVLPAGADTVIPSERVALVGDTIQVLRPVKQGDNVRVAGEDVEAGETVLEQDTPLRAAEISLLASFGKLSPRVVRRPLVAILSTGDELIEPGQRPAVGQVVNSNALSLEAALRAIGTEVRQIGVARDVRNDTEALIREGLTADVLITTAGISVGDRDFVLQALRDAGVELHFSSLKIKPGRPTTFGSLNNTLVFSLPGNPVSTLLTFEEFVRPALLKLMGHRQPIRPRIVARLLEPTKKKPGNLLLLRVIVERREDELIARIAGDQNTGILTTLIRANGIALLDAEREYYEAGERVVVDPIGPID